MKHTTLPVGVMVLSASTAFADSPDHTNHHIEEEIVVTAPFQKHAADTALPVNVLSGEAYRRAVANSLGETLQGQVGVHNSSFGTGVGHPVIRGQSGNRVQILQNSVGNIDVSAVSPDHANGVEPILATSVEVVRGPATLLYGNGAIGGVVNVLDERIPESRFEEVEFLIEQSHDSGSDEDKTVARFGGSLGSFNFHFDGFTRENDNIEIPGFAIDEAALALQEMNHQGDHDDEPVMNTRGFIGNSDAEGDGYTAGFSFSNDRGFIGFAVSELNYNYGLPPGSHEHAHDDHDDEHHDEDHDEDHHDDDHDDEHHDDDDHEDGHDDDHDDEHHDDDDHEDGHDDDHDDDHHDEDGDHDDHEHGEGEEELVRIDMQQTRYDLRGKLLFDTGFIQSLEGQINYTEYEHQELEIEGDGTTFIGTEFRNEGTEGRFTLNRRATGNWTGVWGLQFGDTEFSALGSEAFIPETDTQSLALFGVERYEADKTTLEFGVRWEDMELDPGGQCARDETTTSVSGSLLYDVQPNTNLMVAISRSERAPTLEERYSNVSADVCAVPVDFDDLVTHAATALIEIGNPDLDVETSSNIEFGIRQHSGNWTGELNLFYNQIDDFVYLLETGQFVDEQQVATYLAADADFYGVEASIGTTLWKTEQGMLEFTLQGDYVRAEFDDQGNVPRIPPARAGLGLAYLANHWSVDLGYQRVFEQDDTAVGEASTDGYNLLNLYADYHFAVGQSELQVFAKGTNLLDEEIRNHTSFLRNYAPEAGRSVRVGIRFIY